MENIHTIVIPDVHGRTFWKTVFERYHQEEFPNIPIIFLGDYVDPYSFEGVDKEFAIENFKEIIDVAKKDKRVHLLIGNHDMHYWYDAPYKCRVDKKNYNIIKDIFLQNFTLFNIAYEEMIDDEKFLYTHAGVTRYWLEHLKRIGEIGLEINIGKMKESQIPFCEMLRDMTPDAEKLNKMKLNFQGQANLWMASYERGGEYSDGSCIWADLSEWFYNMSEIPGLWQVFGHSRWSKKDPDNLYVDYERKFACVDTASSWIITNDKQFIKV